MHLAEKKLFVKIEEIYPAVFKEKVETKEWTGIKRKKKKCSHPASPFLGKADNGAAE